MNFFGREKELEILRREEELSASSARFTIVMGRRRIGKTSLIRRNFQGRDKCFILLGEKRGGKLPFCSSYTKTDTEGTWYIRLWLGTFYA